MLRIFSFSNHQPTLPQGSGQCHGIKIYTGYVILRTKLDFVLKNPSQSRPRDIRITGGGIKNLWNYQEVSQMDMVSYLKLGGPK